MSEVSQKLLRTLAQRIILHIDMDAFYAQVEHRRTGIPREEPLAVQQWEGLIAVNYAARARGVSRFMNLAEAKKACPELHCVHVEVISGKSGEDLPDNEDPASRLGRNDGKVSLERYRLASAEVFVSLQRFGVVEKASIDEAYLDVTQEVEVLYRKVKNSKVRDDSQSDDDGEERVGILIEEHVADVELVQHAGELSLESTGSNVYGELDPGSVDGIKLLLGARICRAARRAVRKETGFTCSGGISHNKMLSKLASARHKPDQQTIVPVRGVQSLMEQLPLRSIRGLGGKLGATVCTQLGLVPPEEVEKTGPRWRGGGGDGNAPLAVDAQRFSEGDLQRKLGASTGAWLYRVVRGVDEEGVKERDKAKSMLAFKSFSAIKTMEGTGSWLAMLATELAGRMVQDRSSNARRPKTLTLHFRSRGVGGSRSCPMPAQAVAPVAVEAAVQEALLRQATAMLSKAAAEAFPCNRLALGASDMLDTAAHGGTDIAHFFSAQPASTETETRHDRGEGSSNLKLKPHHDGSLVTPKGAATRPGLLRFFRRTVEEGHSEGGVGRVDDGTTGAGDEAVPETNEAGEGANCGDAGSQKAAGILGSAEGGPSAVLQLVEMGFQDGPELRGALAASKNNVQAAIERLVTGLVSTEVRPVSAQSVGKRKRPGRHGSAAHGGGGGGPLDKMFAKMSRGVS